MFFTKLQITNYNYNYNYKNLWILYSLQKFHKYEQATILSKLNLDFLGSFEFCVFYNEWIEVIPLRLSKSLTAADAYISYNGLEIQLPHKCAVSFIKL